MRDNGNPNLSPTFAEMAARHRSLARSWRYSASKYGEDTPRGRLALTEAASHEAVAADLAEASREAVAARNGMLAEYRKAQANAVATVTYDTRLDPISPDFDIRTWELPCV